MEACEQNITRTAYLSQCHDIWIKDCVLSVDDLINCW